VRGGEGGDRVPLLRLIKRDLGLFFVNCEESGSDEARRDAMRGLALRQCILLW